MKKENVLIAKMSLVIGTADLLEGRRHIDDAMKIMGDDWKYSDIGKELSELIDKIIDIQESLSEMVK